MPLSRKPTHPTAPLSLRAANSPAPPIKDPAERPASERLPGAPRHEPEHEPVPRPAPIQDPKPEVDPRPSKPVL
jgi:hypothetical protein